jgi:hypothetical protein
VTSCTEAACTATLLNEPFAIPGLKNGATLRFRIPATAEEPIAAIGWP